GYVNQTLIEHWNGTAWSIVPSPNAGSGDNRLNGIAAVAANEVWAVGASGIYPGTQALVERWDGSAWTIAPVPGAPGAVSSGLMGAAAAPGGEVWAVGYRRSSQDGQPLTERYS